MSKALIGASLLFSEPNCPTREGELVGFVGEIYNIPSPRVGMRVFVVTERREYIITKLRAKVVNGVSVPNAQVDEFVPAGDARVTWNSSSNLNKFTAAGVYEIKGERTMSPSHDNLPIYNSGGGHTISARLEVLDSSINDTINSDDKCITQKLTLSNRVGGDGNVYIRTGRGKTYDSISWEPWATLQTNINVGDTRTLNKFVDNGIYSGVWTDEYNSYAETFVMVVINDYAIAGENKTVTQFKYAYDTLSDSGIPTFTTRSLFNGEWSNWTSIKGGDGSGGGVTEDEFNALSQKVNSNTNAIANETRRAEKAEKDIAGNLNALNLDVVGIQSDILNIRNRAARVDGNAFSATKNEVKLTTTGVNTSNQFTVSLPSATTERAGVMSAEDKKKLDNLSEGGGSSGGGESSYTLPVATADVLGGVKSNSAYGYVGDNPFGNEHAVNVGSDGRATVTIPLADNKNYGVVKIDNSVNSESNNPVSGKAVSEAIANIGGGGGGGITATPTEEVIEEIEPTLVTNALRKTPQVLTDAEKEIARGNIGAVAYSDLNNAIANAITNTLNTAV